MRLLIVEGETASAQRLPRLCREILGGRLQSLRVADRGATARAWLAANPIDALVLDPDLPDGDGMELLRRGGAGTSRTIIVAADPARAIEAFELGVIDFVAKPVTRERLALALRRVGEAGGRAALGGPRLAVRKRGRIQLVAVTDVHFVQAAGNYVELVLADGRRELHDRTLAQLAGELPQDFLRVHKSYLVRLSTVCAVHAREGSRYEAELTCGRRLPVGRTRYKALRARLG